MRMIDFKVIVVVWANITDVPHLKTAGLLFVRFGLLLAAIGFRIFWRTRIYG
jgi:hypothetical protein